MDEKIFSSGHGCGWLIEKFYRWTNIGDQNLFWAGVDGWWNVFHGSGRFVRSVSLLFTFSDWWIKLAKRWRGSFSWSSKSRWAVIFADNLLSQRSLEFRIYLLPKEYAFDGNFPNSLVGIEKHREHHLHPPRPKLKFHVVYSRNGQYFPFRSSNDGYRDVKIFMSTSFNWAFDPTSIHLNTRLLFFIRKDLFRRYINIILM